MRVPLFLFLILTSLHAPAQRTTADSPLALRVDVLQHSVALPGFKHLFTPFAPGLRAGVVRQGRQGKLGQWRQQAFVGFYRHPRLHDAFLLSGELAYRFRLGPAFLGFSGGPGYMLQLPYAPVYRYTDGRYERAAQVMHRLTFQLATEAGWRFGNGWEAHVRFEGLFEYPYGLNNAPVLPHRVFSLGVLVPLHTNP